MFLKLTFYSLSVHQPFSQLQPATIDRYASNYSRALLSFLRCAAGWKHTYAYQFTEDQKAALTALDRALFHGHGEDLIDGCIHDVNLALWRHTKVDLATDKYFSPLNRFLVLVSTKADGSFRFASEITQWIAQFMYNARAAMLFEMENYALERNVPVSASAHPFASAIHDLTI